MPPRSPKRLASTAYDKIWGSQQTEPWYRNPSGRNIGEVWFAASDSVPLLVKLLFTSDNLSVQVHPGDDYARRHHESRGKTEMWHILRAEPEARIALGLREKVTAGRLGDAALTGEIMELLNWLPARQGDTFFVPAGTIHAIGGGIVLCEVQQQSDVTYRLYDYGRPRDLHLEHGLAVSEPGPPAPYAGRVGLPLESQYFRTDRMAVAGSWISEPAVMATLYIALEGEGLLAGEPFRAGDAWEAPAGLEPFEILSPASAFLITSPRER
jgi:mannose-6-phosphate isomerase